MDTNIVDILNREPNSGLDFFMKIFPVISLLVGALLTLTITLFIQWYNERKKRKQTKAYLIYSIETLITNSKKAKVNLETLVGELEVKPVDIPILNLPIGFNVKSIEIVSFDERFKIFILKKRRKDKDKKAEMLNKFNNSIEIVRATLSYSMDEINALRKYDEDGKKAYNEFFHKMQTILNHKSRRMNGILTADVNPAAYLEQERDKELMLEISLIYSNFFKDKTDVDNIHTLYENLILPIYNVARKRNDFELLTFFPPMIEHCMAMISTREAFKGRFKQFNENVTIAIQYFEEIVLFLK